MSDWTIRRAKAGDASQLAACIDAAYAVYGDRGIDLPAVSDGLTEDIQNNIVWVATLEQQVVGGLVLIPKEDQAVLANVAVAPWASGSGLGRALMECAERQTRQLGLAKLTLTTHVEMPENVRLYEYLGWCETGRSGSKVHMSKALSG